MLPRSFIRSGYSLRFPKRLPRVPGFVVVIAIGFLSFLSISLWQGKCCRCLHGSPHRHPSDDDSSSDRYGDSYDESSSSRGRRSKSSSRRSGSHANSTVDQQPFIYVYDLGPAYTDKVLELEPPWYSHQYDVEKYMSELLLASNAVRTVDPAKASLFFVPFYSSRYMLYHFKDWENNMRQAVEETSKAWVEILTTVRRDFPFFNRTNGRDHFSILTADHGRCHSLTFVDPGLVGEVFFVTYNGDKMVRSIHASKERNMQAITYNYGRPVDPSLPDIPCYLPDRDMVVPVLVAAHLALVSPFASSRDVTLLFCFGGGQHHGVPISHHNHEIRRELLELYRGAGHPGWDFAEKGESETDGDWARAVFCVCPPGHSQWTSRPFKALISGCIPVTFFREHDNPWEDELEHSAFSLNVDPDHMHALKQRIDAVTARPEVLMEMQRSVVRVQEMFKWTQSLDSGAEAMLIKRLRQRAAQLRPFQRQMLKSRMIDSH